MSKPDKLTEEYPLHVVARHVTLTDAMRTYAIEKLHKIDRYGLRWIDATIFLEVEKGGQHLCSYLLTVNNQRIKVSGLDRDMYAAIDLAADRLQQKLRRYLKRLHDHQGMGLHEMDMEVAVVRAKPDLLDEINDQIEEENLKHRDQFMQHEVVERETRALKVLTQEEALVKMELSEDRFMLYRDEADRQLKIIYRRTDGNYGIIQVKG